MDIDYMTSGDMDRAAFLRLDHLEDFALTADLGQIFSPGVYSYTLSELVKADRILRKRGMTLLFEGMTETLIYAVSLSVTKD